MSMSHHTGKQVNLSLTGMRIGPIDPATKSSKVGIKNEVQKKEFSMAEMQPRIMKERIGFSGGFKIPEEIRKSKLKNKGKKEIHEKEDNIESTEKNVITKDEIFQHLNLGHQDSGIGVGKHGTHSKNALAKDLVETLEKDLEKMKRQAENLQLRKQMALKGYVDNDIDAEKMEEEKGMRLKRDLEGENVHVVHASPKRLQVMRHQASHYGTHANFTLEELERERLENQKVLEQLEEQYIRKKENASVGKIIRSKMGLQEDVEAMIAAADKSKKKPSTQHTADQKTSQSQKDEFTFGQSQKQQTAGRPTQSRQDTRQNKDKMTSSFAQSKKSVRINDQPMVKSIGGSDEETTGGFHGFGQQQNSQHQFSSHNLQHDDMYGGQSQPEKFSGFGAANKATNGSRSRSRSKSAAHHESNGKHHHHHRSRGDSPSPPQINLSPRRAIYEAKFEKYLANKSVKEDMEQKFKSYEKEDFDKFTKGPHSPSKKTQAYKVTEEKHCPFNKYKPEALISNTYEEALLEEAKMTNQYAKSNDFKALGVTKEDKTTFMLLKWIFNAIKRESPLEDPKLQGLPYITKPDLVKHIVKNGELMGALGYQSQKQLHDSIQQTIGKKDNCLTWDEFLDFFFLRGASFQNRLEGAHGWWHKVGHLQEEEEAMKKAKEDEDKENKKNLSNKKEAIIPRYKTIDDKKEVKMTTALKMLQDSRKQKTERDVEDEFNKKIDEKHRMQSSGGLTNGLSPMKQTQKKGIKDKINYDMYDEDNISEQFGIRREKSKNLLLKSQIQIMKELFEQLDKYNDQILRRSDFIMSMRTDERIVDFIDVDAVKLAYSNRTLSLDEVLVEIEKDEMYEMVQMGKNADQINHKEFITWREFMTYFDDYKEIEDRNKKTKEVQRTRKNAQAERDGKKTDDDNQNISSLMEKEKERRLKDLPKLRPADMIDISEKQLQLIKDIYDSLQRAPGNKDQVYVLEFFIDVRKNAQIRAINSALARDPEGYSRIPKESFQQVFDRMESEQTTKVIDWITIVEYFTKRGKPLTQDDLVKLQEEDRIEREEAELKKRTEEEAERRRMARLMEDLEEKEDYEEFEERQKSEAAAKALHQQREARHEYSDDDSQDDRQDHSEQEDRSDVDEDDDDDLTRGENRWGGQSKRRIPNDHDEDLEGYQSDPELGTAQRTYDFNQKNKKQRAQSAKGRGGNRDRAQSGKSYDERDLKNVKLTQKDYIDNQHSRSDKKKGKYGVTVPKPFAFDMRDKVKGKTIREVKVAEMVAEKELIEQNLLQHQFRSNPIPPEVLIPRYQAIMDANERRRLEVKKNSMQITKQREKPFNFYLRDLQKQKPNPDDYLNEDLKKAHFKANPIPRSCSVLIFDQMMKKMEEEREQRTRKNAELSYQKASLPPRMEMHQKKKQQEPPKKGEADMYPYKPLIGELVTREQFKKKQDRFNDQLKKKQSQKKVTKPQSPNFHKSVGKGLNREYLNEGARVVEQDKFQKTLAKAIASGEDSAAANPPSTKGMNLAMSKRREYLEDRRKNEESKKKEDEDRVTKQQRLKTVVQAALADRIKDDTEKREQKMRDKKMKDAKAELETKQKLKEAEQRGRSRPFLIEQLHSGKPNSTVAKMKATEKYIQILKDSGIKNVDEHLTDEQKELLEEKRYTEMRKKQLGR